VRCNPPADFTKYWSGDQAALVLNTGDSRIIDDNDANKRGVLGGHHSGERGDHAIQVIATLRIMLLNRPGLTCHEKSGDRRAACSASRDDLFQRISHLPCCLWLEHLADDLGSVILDDRAIVCNQRPDDVRLAKVAVSRNHRVGARKLQRRNVRSIAVTRPREIDFIARVARRSRAFTAQKNPGLATKSVVLQVVVEALRSTPTG